MKRNFYLKSIALIGMFISVVSVASAQINAKVYLTFDGNEIIPTGVTGVQNVDGTDDYVLESDGLTHSSLPNEIYQETNPFLWIDYLGYLSFDETILNKNQFTLACKYQWFGNAGWWLGFINFTGVDNGTKKTSDYQIRKDVDEDIVGSGLDRTQTAGSFPKEVFKDIVFTYNEGNVAIYVDGELKSSGTASKTIHTWTDLKLNLGAKFIIENDQFVLAKDANGYCRNTQAYIDNVALFDVALTAQQVADIYNGTGVVTGMDKVQKDETLVTYSYLNNSLHIYSPAIKTIEIINLAGTSVGKYQVTSNNIDASSLDTGLYIVRCIDAQGKVIAVNKVVKR